MHRRRLLSTSSQGRHPRGEPQPAESSRQNGFGLGSPTIWVNKLPVTVAVPIRQTKDVDQHLRWDNGPVFRDFKKTKTKKKQGRGHWNKFLRVALLGCSSNPSLVGHRAFLLLLFENLKKMCFVLPLVIYEIT